MSAVLIGAHCSACRKLKDASERTDLLLWAYQQAQEVGGSGPFVIVYTHSHADLSLFPDMHFFRLLHACIGRNVRRNLRAIFVLHPNRHWYVWLGVLRVLANDIYSKVQHVDTLDLLFQKLPGLRLADLLPQHVMQCDAERLAAKTP